MATSGQLTWTRLVAIARRVGVKVIEAPSSHRGTLGNMGSVVGATCHHTGTPNTYSPASDYPDYNVVKEGRTGLWNSLSAYGLGRRDAIYVFSEFLSWHAGEWNWQGITDGNGHFLGIECAGVGDFTDFQRQVYPRLVAAILLDVGAPNGHLWAPRHLDGAMPRGRKSDAANFDGNFYQGKSFYQWVDFFLANPAYININYGGDDMPLTDADVAKILDWAVRKPDGGTRTLSQMIAADEGYGARIERIDQGEHGGWGYGRRIENTEAVVAQLVGQVAGLTEALKQLAAAPGQAVDLGAVKTAVEDAVKGAIDSIDVTLKLDNGTA